MSITYIGIAVAMLAKLMEFGGVEIGTEQLTEFVTTFVVVIAGFVALYGRWRRGDLKWFGGRREPEPTM